MTLITCYFLLDKVGIRISFEGYNTTFSDVTNTFFPSPQQINFQEYTENITFTCSLDECVWLIQLVNSKIQTLTMPSYRIPSFTKTYEGNYSLLLRTTNSGRNYTTAQLSVNLITVPTQHSASLPFIPIIIVVLVIICIIILIIVLIPICIKIFGNKRELFHSKQFKNENTESPLRRGQHNNKGSKISQSNIIGSGGFSGYENLAKLQSPAKEYIELSVNTNVAEYMTIDETSMLPLDIETKVHNMEGPYYSNLANNPSDGNYEQVKENSEYMELNQSEPYERYTPMSAVKEKTKFVAKYIPSKDFPAAYQQYVTSGMGIHSLFPVEFQALNEESKKNIEPSDEARREQNMRKNPLKNILPYDENRVVLDSPYFDCNYINGSYINDFQFIASIHPTVDTLQDFLQMIYQTEASMVIMLTTRKEKAKIIGGVSNRVCYWPKKDKPLNCEPFVTSLISSTETTAFVKQEISLKNTLEGKDHSFTHCISPIWNEDGTVVEMMLAVALLIRIMKQKQDSPTVPIIIHCTDGIAKTGIIMTALNTIKELNARKSINIFNAVKNLRKQRNNMVPTLVSLTGNLVLFIE